MKRILKPFITVLFLLIPGIGIVFSVGLPGNDGNHKLGDRKDKEVKKEGEFAKPFVFVENKGQLIGHDGKLHPEILYYLKNGATTIYVTATGLHYQFTKQEGTTEKDAQAKAKAAFLPEASEKSELKDTKTSTHRFALNLVGAKPEATVLAENADEYKETYFYPHCPNGLTVNTYNRLRVKNVYPGIDWVIYNHGKGIKYDFVVAPGSDANKIRLKVEDAEAKITNKGELQMKTSLGEILEEQPVSYQNERKMDTKFIVHPDGTFGFDIKKATANATLTIDPTVGWTVFSDGYGESTIKCASDPFGNALFSGTSSSAYLPVSGFQITLKGNTDAFIFKVGSTGRIVWSTYYGSSKNDYGLGCGSDKLGNVYLVGKSDSSNLPVTAGAFQTVKSGANNYDGFVVKFGPTGNRIWASFIGGASDDAATAVTSDKDGNVVVAGGTYSTNFPISAGAFQPSNNGGQDVFITKFTAAGARIYGTYCGGTADELATSCATDTGGNLFVAGNTSSRNFPVYNAYMGPGPVGNTNAFLAKFNKTGYRIWGTYFGGNGGNTGQGCATDPDGNVFLAGGTGSLNFPATGSYSSGYPNYAYSAAYVAKFTTDGNIVWATCYGNGYPYATTNYGCTSDVAGNVITTGYSINLNGNWAYPTFNQGFVVKYSPSGQTIWTAGIGGVGGVGTYGQGNSVGNGVCTDPTGSVFVAGSNQADWWGSSNAFIRKLEDFAAPAPKITGFSPTSAQYGQTITITGSNFTGTTVVNVGGFPVKSYTVVNATTITAVIGCNATGSVEVTALGGTVSKAGFTYINPNPPTITASGPLGIPSCSSLTLTASPGLSYVWSTGETTQSITVTNSGYYKVTIQNNNGCSFTTASSTIVVVTTPSPSQSAPTGVGTLAGTGTKGTANGAGTVATFNLPYAVATDLQGNTYVADRANHLIRKISATGVVSTLAGSGTMGFANGTGTAAQFNEPTGLVLDAAGNVYVSDYFNHRIRKITPAGVVTTFAGAGAPGGFADGAGTVAKFNGPWGLAIDAAGNLFVADQNNNKIRKITPAGVVSTFAGSTAGYADGLAAVAKFNSPLGVAIDAAGTVYIADYGNNRIRSIANGNVGTLAGSGQGCNADGQGVAAAFNGPAAISINSSGQLAVADRYNNRIRSISTTGLVSSLAGSIYGFADGFGYDAKFSSPFGLAYDNEGNLLVADRDNNRIRKIAACAAPVVTASGTTSVCTGSAVTLTASSSAGYLWSNGATTRSITVNNAGVYSVKAINGTCTSGSSNVITVTVAPCREGVNVVEQEVNVYPNPFTNTINLNLGNAGSEKTEIRLIDALGHEVLYQNLNKTEAEALHQIEAGHLPAGIYQLQIITDEAIKQQRVFKQ